eukprot:CAMPEP_0202858714 /NCGR_PEP_ID=MMETSP1391-20130828/1125_1 /ASSEMBLY_ACC=CAM_ASM_000867 /TAXON_ID=1034604 /ORGANISM="Chlamydomonas leiostraca, Strain SAG 11-49" /LENGTH=141 /DNA_ID=CAMNT_0049537659 /DNA_START=146 /DNA_END=571 /DNA_ORIENTATION=+
MSPACTPHSTSWAWLGIPQSSCRHSLLAKLCKVLHAASVCILRPVVWGPHRLAHKQTHRLGIVVGVQGEPVVDALRQHQQVILAGLDADPPVLKVAHIKVAAAVQDEANLLVTVDVLCVECLQLLLIAWQRVLADRDDLHV